MKKIIYLLLALIVLLGGCKQKLDITLNETKETPATSPIKLDLSISPINEERFAEVTLTVKSERNIQNASGKIILPEAYVLVEGNLEWKTDLEANKPEEFKIKVKVVKEGNWVIEATTEDNSASAQLPTKIEPSRGVYINESEFYKDRVRSWSACYGFECFTPAERKGQDSINYFRSLNLTDDYIYVIMQFEDLGGDPSRQEMDILATDNISLFEYHGDHSYYAKAPRAILESKSYDFVRWVGIAENASLKVDGSLGEKVSKNCTGYIKLDVILYQKITDVPDYQTKIDLINDLSKNVNVGSENIIVTETDVKNIYKIASLNFVQSIWPVVLPSICPPRIGNRTCGYNPFANVTCVN